MAPAMIDWWLESEHAHACSDENIEKATAIATALSYYMQYPPREVKPRLVIWAMHMVHARRVGKR